MEITYQNVNVDSGNESTLLHFDSSDGPDAHVLVDAGDGVGIESHLHEDEYLSAICLTHGHIDHYRSLGRNVLHSAPIYTAPDTATILDRALPEATQYNDLGDVEAAREALTPIDDWEPILDTLAVRPVSVGHAPGAVGFLFRCEDETLDDELTPSTRYVLATGDFTTRPCAGYPGLAETLPVDVGAVLLNATTDESCVENLNDVLETILERAYSGSRVVVATGSLTGVHLATLLGTLADELERSLPIRLVGQAAKHYERLDYDIAGVETTPDFADPDDVLTHGGVTICGPETATAGSAARLRGAVETDPEAAVVQVTTGGADPITGTACATYQTPLVNHPTPEQRDDVIASLAPTQVVIKHAMGRDLNRLQKHYDRCFTWGTDDDSRHTIYDGGGWSKPGWIAEQTAQQIRSKQWQAAQEGSFEAAAEFDALSHDSVDLAAEGVAVERFEARFTGSSSIRASTAAERAAESAPDTSGSQTAPSSSGTEQAADGPVTSTGKPDEPAFEQTVLEKLETIESRLDDESAAERFTARVLSGNGDTFLQLLDDADLEAGEIVDVRVKTRTENASRESEE